MLKGDKVVMAIIIAVEHLATVNDNIAIGHTIQPNTTNTTTLLHLHPNQWKSYFASIYRGMMPFCKAKPHLSRI